MRFLFSLAAGAAAGVVAILLHQSVPPIGVIVALFVTYCTVWAVGRRFSSRTTKWCAALGWILVLLRGSSFGEGQELLVQGDGVGSTLLLLGTLILFFAIAARV